jgi:hypothetical protein
MQISGFPREKIKMLLNEKRSIVLFATDVYLILGVIVFGWNPARMIGFCLFDAWICLLSYVIYNIISKYTREVITIFIATALVSLVFWFALLAIASTSNNLSTGHTSPDIDKLLFPYYDVAIFIFGSVTSHILNVRRYIRYPVEISRPAFSIFIGLMIFMVPFLYIFNTVLMSILIPLKISLIISFITARHLIEHRRYRSFKEIENEIALLKAY